MGDTRKTKGDLNWANLLSEERKVPAEEVPGGWKNAREIAAETEKSLSHTSWLLRVGVAEGRIEMQKFSINVGHRNYPVPHYRIVE